MISSEDDQTQLSFAGDATGTRLDTRPLAERLRPTTIDEVIGQERLLGADQPLRRALDANALHSMIFWGPPGTGKTTLARLVANHCECAFIALSAVLAGVKDVRAAVAQAEVNLQAGRRTVLFIDEVHRFNKAQQDAFLPHVENGTVTLIGATTENPSFEVNAALLSRARVYVLQALGNAALKLLAKRGAAALNLALDDDVAEMLAAHADGDGRKLLNVLEGAAQLARDGHLDSAQLGRALGENLRRFDKGGDVFYEQISALHKALRGSAPDAALYWFCRMLDGGADPRYVGRRLVRFASEDIGNADPRALSLCLDAVTTFERLGSPEGELALAQAVLYLASVPKSNAVYEGFNQAMQTVREGPSYPVPMHIRNAPTGLMKDLGYGENYRYAHSEETAEGAYAAGENYFPDEMPPAQFYFPKNAGLEGKIAERLQRLRTLDAQARGDENG